MQEFSSQLMVGQVRHRRFSPMTHALDYPLFMPCIDLDELEQLEASVWGFGQKWWHWARFNRQDYLGGSDECLKLAVQNKVEQLTGRRCQGKVLAVCHLRYVGIYFSPVNFYYLYDKEGNWQYLLAEVSNTPWNERHYYALKADAGENNENWQHAKAFHVSPFNPIDMQYIWKVKPLSQRLMVHLECHKESKHFDATLTMKAQEFNSRYLIKHLLKTPIMAVKVIAGIYWHALKLWIKGAPFYSHAVLKDKPEQANIQKNKKKENKENSSC